MSRSESEDEIILPIAYLVLRRSDPRTRQSPFFAVLSGKDVGESIRTFHEPLKIVLHETAQDAFDNPGVAVSLTFDEEKFYDFWRVVPTSIQIAARIHYADAEEPDWEIYPDLEAAVQAISYRIARAR